MKKTLFTFNIDNIISLITNSSSELFILREESLETVKEMITQEYPDYLTEYEEVVALRDASPRQIEDYISYVEDNFMEVYESTNFNKLSPEERAVVNKEYHANMAKKFGMEPEEYYENWGHPELSYYFVKHEALAKIAQQLDPNGTIFLLFSINENPKWENQERLMNIGERIHMG